MRILILLILFVSCNRRELNKDTLYIICLSGFEYHVFENLTGYKGFRGMALKLDDNGKYVRCRNENQ